MTDLGKNRNDPWHKYQGRNGHALFCRDMGHALIERGFTMDAPDIDNLQLKENRPKYARSIDWPVPCKDRVCFFCKKGYTCGVAHARFKVRMNNPPVRPGPFPVETHPKERVKVTQGECVVCLRNYRIMYRRKHKSDPTLSYIRAHGNLQRPGLGCNLCRNKRGGRGVPVCSTHWENYVHEC